MKRQWRIVSVCVMILAAGVAMLFSYQPPVSSFVNNPQGSALYDVYALDPGEDKTNITSVVSDNWTATSNLPLSWINFFSPPDAQVGEVVEFYTDPHLINGITMMRVYNGSDHLYVLDLPEWGTISGTASYHDVYNEVNRIALTLTVPWSNASGLSSMVGTQRGLIQTNITQHVYLAWDKITSCLIEMILQLANNTKGWTYIGGYDMLMDFQNQTFWYWQTIPANIDWKAFASSIAIPFLMVVAANLWARKPKNHART